MSSRPNGFDPNQKRDGSGRFAEEHGTRPAAGGLARRPSVVPEENAPTLRGLDPAVYAKARSQFQKIAQQRLAPFGNMTGVDDAVQDAFESILKQAASQGRNLNDMLGSSENSGLRARIISTTTGWQHPDAQNQERHEYIKARKLLAESEQQHHDEHGRGFNAEERKAAAEKIRMTWPAKSRPRADFYVKNTFVSFDAPAGSEEGSATVGDLTQQPTYLAQHSDDDSDENAGFVLTELRIAEDSDQASKDKGRGNPGNAAKIRKAVRASVWNDVIVTGSTDLPIPEVKEQYLSAEEATKSKKIVASAGGAGALAGRWLDKDPSITPSQERALFAPFAPDEIPKSRLEAAAIALDERQQFADRLWGDALATATQT